MNNTVKQQDQYFHPDLWWLKASFCWLGISAILGALKSIILLAAVAEWTSFPSLPWGRIYFAAKGTFLYGWCFSAMIGLSIHLFPALIGKNISWNKSLWAIYQLGVALGVISIFSGCSSGIQALPFAQWVIPFIAFPIGGVVMLIIGNAYDRRDALSGFAITAITSVFSLIFIFLILIYVHEGAGVSGVMLTSCYSVAIAMCALMISITAFLKHSEGGGIIIKKLCFTLLSIAVWMLVPFAGLATIAAWPVPWNGIYWGLNSSFCLSFILIIVCGIGLYCSWKEFPHIPEKERPAFINKNAGAALMILWLVWKVINPLTDLTGITEYQLTLTRWYSIEIFMLTSVGLVGIPIVAVKLKSYANWKAYLWMAACLVPALTSSMILYAFENTPPEQKSQASCHFIKTGLIPGMEAVICLVIIITACLLCFDWNDKNMVLRNIRPAAKKFNFTLCSSILLFMAIVIGTILKKLDSIETASRNVVPFESLRPGKNLEGSTIYAAEGCAVCHTQIIRRLFSGDDLQEAVNAGGLNPEAYRVSEPQDFDLEMKEGGAHVGYAKIGPDFSNLADRVSNYISYKDENGQYHPMATPKEWLLLHLYNPRDAKFGEKNSLCPPMPHLFKKIPANSKHQTPLALPVACEQGYAIIPTPKALALVDYLMTLKRSERPEELGGDSNYIHSHRSHINPQYVKNPPAIDFSVVQKEQTARILEKGRRTYQAKCSVCHGASGNGDDRNYPPINNSEWLTEKEPGTIARIIKNGIKGPIKVKNKEWNSTMPPPGIANAEELAPLMTFILDNFGNRKEPVISMENAKKLWEQAGNLPIDERTTEQ